MSAGRPPTFDELPLFGEVGVLAYDEVVDRIQCHACGRWLQKIEARHLSLHGLTIPEYKEIYGLNITTPLETPRITEVRRRHNREHEGWRNLTHDHDFVTLARRVPRATRAQFRLEHLNSERQRERAREWTEEEMIAHLRRLQARHGGVLRRGDLDADRPGGRGIVPSRTAILERLGGWQRVCEILGQPYRRSRPRTSGRWTNRGYAYRTLPAAYQAALAFGDMPDGGYRVRLAPGVVPGVKRNPILWTDGATYRVYEDVEGGRGMAETVPVPNVWRVPTGTGGN